MWIEEEGEERESRYKSMSGWLREIKIIYFLDKE